MAGPPPAGDDAARSSDDATRSGDDATGLGDPRPDGLTHIDESGQARMVEVGTKPITQRTAVARSTVVMSPATARRLASGDLPKGDALPVVRLAGIQAAKLTPQLIPLCHQISLTSVDMEVAVDPDTGVATIVATARAVDRTGVEMEAMTAASVAALAMYDLVKAVQRDVVVSEVVLLAKSGGRSGEWRASD